MVGFLLAEKARLQHPGVYRADVREASAAGSVFLLGRLERNRFRLKRFRSSILVEHDLFGKPASILGSSPRTSFFRIML